MDTEAYRSRLEMRLITSLTRVGNCLEWQGKRDAEGYGLTWATASFMGLTSSNNRRVHRVVWTLHYGVIGTDLNVLHHCDNPPCADITHLFLGTTDDNVQDKIRKGRLRTSPRNRRDVVCPCGVIFEVTPCRPNARFHTVECMRRYR